MRGGVMNKVSVSDLVRQAKGEDRSLREYARDSGVDAAIISRIMLFIPPGSAVRTIMHSVLLQVGCSSLCREK